MTKNHPDISCHCLLATDDQCRRLKVDCPEDALPLTQRCGCGRVKVCKISGDRKECAKMANLGVLPGTEMELLCPSRGNRRKHRNGRGSRCMVKINGGTLSLDQLTAENIFVTPL